MKLVELTINEVHQGLGKKEFSALDLTRAYLAEIESKDSEIKSYLTVSSDPALSQAREIDRKINAGEKIDILSGVPCAIKDNILVEGLKCTAGSKILENYIAPYDATVIKKLKEKGAVILGKTNLDEFAMGSSTENSGFFATRNPWDKSRVPGGSSGGSAAAVAAGMACYALGSDTGGSIRQPAAFCGLVGLKPTYGAVSRYGLIAMASSLDQIGPLAKNIEDAKIVFEAIRGKDPLDATGLEFPFLNQIKSKPLKDLVMGIPKEYFIEGMDSEVEKMVKEVIKKYEENGVGIREVSLPHTKYAVAVYYIIMPSEVSANLARYDGIKYGFSVESKNLLEAYLQSRKKGFGQEPRRRIVLGTYALSAGYYDAYYLRAQKVRALVKKDFEEAFRSVDFILTPTSPTVAFKIGEKTADPLKMYLSDIFTIAANLAGLPAISVPCRSIDRVLADSAGVLPVGFQIIGRPLEECKILEIANIFKKK